MLTQALVPATTTAAEYFPSLPPLSIPWTCSTPNCLWYHCSCSCVPLYPPLSVYPRGRCVAGGRRSPRSAAHPPPHMAAATPPALYRPSGVVVRGGCAAGGAAPSPPLSGTLTTSPTTPRAKGCPGPSPPPAIGMAYGGAVSEGAAGELPPLPLPGRGSPLPGPP